MSVLKIFTDLTLVFKNGELAVVHRRGRAYKVHEVQVLQDMKFGLGKSRLMLIDLQQFVSIKSPDVTIHMSDNTITLRNVNF